MRHASSLLEAIEALYRQKRFGEAAELVESALDVHCDDGQLWRMRGLVCRERGDFGSAATSFEHAGMLVPLSAEDQCVLADCYAHLGRECQARDIYEHLSEDPHCASDVLPMVAAGLGRIGEFDLALEVCRLAASREPAQPEPLFGMVFYLCKLGYSVKVTIPLMRRAMELAPRTPFYRSTLAFMLAEDDQTEEAYDLLKDLSPAKVACRCQVRRMMAVFQSMRDFERWRECQRQLKQMGSMKQ